MDFASGFHPLQLFAVQVLTTSLVIGFSTSHSLWRPAILPLSGLCAYGIITSSRDCMRLHWASLLSGTSNGFVLQYVELALLSRWSFETKRYVFGYKREGLWSRICFGFLSTFSFRSVNTPLEVKNVPVFKNGPPSRSVFVARQIIITIMCMLVVDISSAQPPPPNPAELFSPEKVLFFTRLADITKDEMILRVLSTFIYWANMYAIMQGVTSAAATVAVGIGISEVEAWRPIFGSPAMACNLRGFWGIFWHQTLRQILSHPASFITHKVLKQSGIVARYLKLFLTFAISGVLHTFAEFGGGLALERSGTLQFFCLQVAGIMIEDAMKAMFPRRSRGVGYVWVVCFLVWSTPGWLYPDAMGPPKKSFLSFSLITYMK